MGDCFFLQKLIQAYFCHSGKLATHFLSNLAREVAGYSAGGPGSILASLKKFLNQVSLAYGGRIKMDQASYRE